MAGVCFLVMPLKLGHRAAARWTAGWARCSAGSSPPICPTTSVPSLHIALRTILAETYARHTRGLWNIASHVWFSLVGFSTLLTYQHHVVDVAGGFLLAAVCFYLVPAIAHGHPVTPNRRIGSYYFLAAVAAGVAAALLWPWGSILLWPAAACLVAAAAYFGLGPGIYRKIDGRLTLSTRLVLAPLLVGQNLSLRYYRRQCRAWDEVTPHVWIGRKLSDREAADAVRQGVTRRSGPDRRVLRGGAVPGDPLPERPQPSAPTKRDESTCGKRHHLHGTAQRGESLAASARPGRRWE